MIKSSEWVQVFLPQEPTLRQNYSENEGHAFNENCDGRKQTLNQNSITFALCQTKYGIDFKIDVSMNCPFPGEFEEMWTFAPETCS